MFLNNPSITQKEIKQNTAFARSTIQRIIEELKEMGRLQRTGSRKKGSWIVKD